MPPSNIRKIRKQRKGRGRIYLASALILIVAIAVAWFVYSSLNPPDFAITAPTGVTVYAGQQKTSRVNIEAINNFAGTVHLTVNPSSGLTATISPANVTGSGSATLTMTATSNGTYTVTITGSSGDLTHSVAPNVATPVYATLATSNGTMLVELYQAQAPRTVTNFVNLAKGGFYNNLVWHRIVKSPNVIQTGDPNSRDGLGDRSQWGSGGSSQTVPLEIDTSLHNNVGFLGMARSSDPNSGSSQFYINLGNNNYLDGQYTVFGKVVSGLDAANAIGNHPVDSPQHGLPLDPLPFLTSVTIS